MKQKKLRLLGGARYLLSAIETAYGVSVLRWAENKGCYENF